MIQEKGKTNNRWCQKVHCGCKPDAQAASHSKIASLSTVTNGPTRWKWHKREPCWTMCGATDTNAVHHFPLWSILGLILPSLQAPLFLHCIYAQATWWIEDPLWWKGRLSIVSIHAECVFVLLVVNSIHAECVFVLLLYLTLAVNRLLYILLIYTRVLHVYIFLPFSPTVIYMHKYTIAFFINRYLLHMYTLIVYLNIFSLISPTIIYFIYVFYVNSKLS